MGRDGMGGAEHTGTLVGQLDPTLRGVFSALPPVPADEDFRVRRRAIDEQCQRLRASEAVSPDVDVEDMFLPAGEGARRLRLRLYRSIAWSDGCPGMLWMHGGGFVAGCPELDDLFCARAAHELNGVVVSVDYRLAPEFPYPAALDDCLHALAWCLGDDSSLGLVLDRLAFGGISAGGALASGLALRLRDRGDRPPRYLMLQYPCLDDRHGTRSSRLIDDPRVWNRQRSLLAWGAYLGSSRSDVPIYAAPSRAADLSGLPPTYVLAAGLDLVRDEAVAFANALIAADVETELHVVPGAFHAFDRIAPDAALSRRVHDEMVDALVRSLGRGRCGD